MYTKIFLLISLQVALYSAPAISGLRIFTQADGTQFIGELKGDSSFHWIQSNGEIIIYNPDDKFYYKAVITRDKGLVSTGIKPKALSKTQQASSLKQVKQKDISQEDKLNLRLLNKKIKSKNHPQ